VPVLLRAAQGLVEPLVVGPLLGLQRAGLKEDAVNANPPNGDIFGSVGSEGLKVAGVVGVVLLAPMLFLMAALGGTPGIAQSPASASALAEIPPEHLAVMQQVAATTGVPWQVLAAVAKVESGFGTNMGPSSAGALGYCQFMPATWALYGVDGDGDGRADITNDADSAMSAANYLTASGVTAGPDGVRRAIFAYNHADWYVNDVLYYAAAYGGGTVPGDPSDCGPGGIGNPNLPPIDNAAIAALLTWAQTQIGDPYVFGANGPDAWDCSSFTQAAYAQIGITIPRTASAQRNWLAAGNGFRVPAGQERPGDLLFVDSYLGPNQIGHVMIVFDPATHLTVEAGGAKVGNYDYSNWADHHIYEFWRVGATH